MLVGELRQQLAAAGARLAAAGLVRESEGNLSARVDWRSCLVTATGAELGRLRFSGLIEVPLDAREIPAGATSELALHLGLLQSRGDVAAVVHAHPPTVLRLAAEGKLPDRRTLDEDEQLFGRVVEVPYLQEGSVALAQAAVTALTEASSCVLLDHGAVTVGVTVEEALRRMLSLERAAARTLRI